MWMLNTSMGHRPRIRVGNELCIVYPRGSSKTCSNIIIVGRDPAVIIDAGGYNDPGPSLLLQALKKFGTSPEKVTAILITHAHIDHVGGLSAIARKLPNARIYCHETEVYNVLHHFRAMNAWKQMFRYNNFSPVVYAMYWTILTMIDILQSTRSQRARKIVGIKDDTFQIQTGIGMIHPIITAGHSSGHICYLCDNGDLFLGDMIPRTPWLDLGPNVLQTQIHSIKRLIDLPSNKVHRAIRSHANTRDKGRSIYPWDVEREKFQQQLDLIYQSLELIPRLLKNRELTVPQLLPLVIRGARPYSKFFTEIYIDPNTTWVAAYLEELELQGKVWRNPRQGKIWWSA